MHLWADEAARHHPAFAFRRTGGDVLAGYYELEEGAGMSVSRFTIYGWIRVLPLAAVICGGENAVSLPSASGADTIMVTSPKPEPSKKVPWGVPFNAADVVRYFTEALETRPTVSRGGYTVFESPKRTNPEDQYRVVIQQEDGEVVLHFSAGGDYGMNLAREFFECQLFKRKESEQLYALLNEAAKAPVMPMGRFSVSARSWETRDRIHLVLRFFQPSQRVQVIPALQPVAAG